MVAEHFFSRWSQRKQAVREGKPLAPAERVPMPPTASPIVPASPEADAAAKDARAHGAAVGAAPVDAAPPLTLQDAQGLCSESDFSPFVQKGVDPQVRNMAMKKLFADPRFNVMDGLDTYIDDYSRPDPLPLGMLQQMASAQFMQLVDAPEAPPGRTEALPSQRIGEPEAVPQPVPPPLPHDDPDL